MLTERKARELIRAAWADWDGRTGAASDKAAFHEWLVESKPSLLHFEAKGDRKRLVMAWLSGT